MMLFTALQDMDQGQKSFNGNRNSIYCQETIETVVSGQIGCFKFHNKVGWWNFILKYSKIL
jgi:hypothetical protein